MPHTAGAQMAVEINQQPDMFARMVDDTAQAQSVAAAIRAAAPRFVLFAARGTSDHAALFAKYFVEVQLGLPAGLASPSTLTAYGSRPDMRDVLWVAVSQSGGSPDLVESTQVARECGALTLAVTNSPGSPLASAAQLTVDIGAGEEKAVAATKTYTAQLLALWQVLTAWREGDLDVARGLPAHARTLLDAPEVLEVAHELRYVDHVITTGRGYSYPTAREAALKVMETSYLAAQAFSGADLLHGPLAMVDADRPVLAVVPAGIGGRAMAPVLERLVERGTDVTVIGDPGLVGGALARSVVPLPADVPEDLSPVLEILPFQRLSHALAVARHLDPDAPRGLAKVTQTW